MNYIKQLNAFYSLLDVRPLSSSAISLWHALLHINNKTGWRKSFTVAGVVLRLKSGLNESSFKRARQELTEKDCITYMPGRGNQAPSYQLTCLSHTMNPSTDVPVEEWPADDENSQRTDNVPDYNTDYYMDHSLDHNAGYSSDCNTEHNANRNIADFAPDHGRDHNMDYTSGHNADYNTDRKTEHNIEDFVPDNGPDYNVDHSSDYNASHSTDHSANHTADPLVKQKHKQIHKPNKTTAADAIAFHEENIGHTPPFIRDSITNWMNDVGEPLVLEAMKRAIKRNKPSWNYVKGILQAWVNTGIHTVDAARAEETTFRGSQGTSGRKPGSGEVVPDWFHDWKKQRKAEPRQMPQQTPEQFAETERLLAKFRKKAK
ncbi:DnaD domain protein [Lentibacillus cibarius]|uniref:DnaD domain protein n=1 Tax=Lentibacillus cibarius TaxID=2583219 RepID=A0A549YGI6_9BACI|nr:DnaD domain protein [Lentibacillus cibarius]TRM10947.1 DnaD domain protein [Lentibacillus cibarius]